MVAKSLSRCGLVDSLGANAWTIAASKPKAGISRRVSTTRTRAPDLVEPSVIVREPAVSPDSGEVKEIADTSGWVRNPVSVVAHLSHEA